MSKNTNKIKLIATDIDGTILKHNFQFNQEIKDCIKKLKSEDIMVVLVTGRMHSATTYIAEELGLDTPIVSYQGGLIKNGEEIIYEKYLNPERARSILTWASTNSVHLNLYMDDKLYVEKDDAVIRRYTGERAAGFLVKSFADIELDKINKLLAIDFEDENKVTMWRDYISNKYDEVDVVKSMPYFCEITHPEATKYHAIKFLTDYFELSQDEVLTIGDQDNDIGLLKAGGIKVAMGNATENLKAVADYITDTVSNNGFVKAVEKFVEGYSEARL